MGKSQLYEFAAELKIETKLAYLLNDGEKEFWVPKSLCENNQDGTFTVPSWFAEKEGLV